VRERELRLTGDARAARAPQELLSLEPEHQLVGGSPVALAERAERAQPDCAPDHGSILQQALLLGGERVEAGGNDALHRLGESARVGAALDQHAHVLLRIERVPVGAGEQLSLGLDLEHGRVDQGADQLSRLGLGERLERDRERIRLAAGPTRAALPQLRASRTHDQQRHGTDALDESVQELEQRLVGPVQILHHQHGRPVGGQGLDEHARAGERLLAAAGLTARLDSGKRGQLPAHPERIDTRQSDRRDRLVKLRRRGRRVVRFEDARLLLDDLRERPECDALPVGEHAPLPPSGDLRLVLHMRRQLLHQAALADPRHPDDRDQLHRALRPATLERVHQQPPLPLPADERRLLAHRPRHQRARLTRHPTRKRLGLALRRHRFVRLEEDRALGHAEGGRVHQHPVHGRERL